MNVIKLVFILFVILPGVRVYPQQAQKRTAVQRKTARPAGPQKENTLLWEVSGNGLTQPSYLFGTMHMLCDSEAVLSKNLKEVIAKSSKVYFEIDMDDMQEMMGALKYIRMNDGQKLSQLLTPEEYARVKAYFAGMKTPMPMSMIDRMKPLFTSSLVGEQMLDCPKKNAMEQVIMQEAKSHEIEIRGLESAAFQAGLFDSIPYGEQARELMAYIDSIDVYRKNTEAMMQVYREQNLDRLDSLVSKTDPGMENYMDLLLYSRNRKWVQQMPMTMREGSSLFAVGAGHLVGDQGLIALLRRQGYHLKPIANNW